MNDACSFPASHGQNTPRAPGSLFILWLALYILTASGRITPGDEETMFRVTDRLASRGRLDIGRETVAVEPLPGRHDLLPHRVIPLCSAIETTSAVIGADGRLYSKYGIGQSLAALPFWTMGRALNWAMPAVGSAYAVRFTASFLNALATALAAWLVADTGLALRYRARTAVALSACYGLTTMAWPFAKNWYSEPAVTALVLLAFDAGIRAKATGSRGAIRVSGAAFGAALLFRIASLIWLPAFLVLSLWPGTRFRARRTAALLIATLIAVALTAAYNVVRFSSPLSFGYPEAHWDTPFVGGLIGLLVSPGKGLFVYNPVLVLGFSGLLIWRSQADGRRAEGACVFIFAAITLAYIAPYHFWTGGWNWGPRFLLPLVPLLILPVGAMLEAPTGARARFVWGALCVLGLWINLPAVLVDHSRYLITGFERDPDQFLARSIWEPAHSPAARQWTMVSEAWALWSRHRTVLAQGALRYAPDALGVIQREEFLRWNAPDSWQAHWSLLKLPRSLPILVSALCIVAACWAGFSLRSVIVHGPPRAPADPSLPAG